MLQYKGESPESVQEALPVVGPQDGGGGSGPGRGGAVTQGGVTGSLHLLAFLDSFLPSIFPSR